MIIQFSLWFRKYMVVFLAISRFSTYFIVEKVWMRSSELKYLGSLSHSFSNLKEKPPDFPILGLIALNCRTVLFKFWRKSLSFLNSRCVYILFAKNRMFIYYFLYHWTIRVLHILNISSRIIWKNIGLRTGIKWFLALIKHQKERMFHFSFFLFVYLL